MKTDKLVFGCDFGTNSIGWAELHEDADGVPSAIGDIGSGIFIKVVEDKVPTPMTLKRSLVRLARRIVQRRARCRSKLQNYLISLRLTPSSRNYCPHSHVVKIKSARTF